MNFQSWAVLGSQGASEKSMLLLWLVFFYVFMVKMNEMVDFLYNKNRLAVKSQM